MFGAVDADSWRTSTTRGPSEPVLVRADVESAAAEPIEIGGGAIRLGTASWTDPTMTAAGVFLSGWS